MIVTAGTHVEVPNDFLAQIRVPAGFAFLPRISGNLEALSPRLTRLLLLADQAIGEMCPDAGAQARDEPNPLLGARRRALPRE